MYKESSRRIVLQLEAPNGVDKNFILIKLIKKDYCNVMNNN